ncbi:MAG: MBL fold metallo-hydrolase [Stigonema ocellatum SAG 48.90 = DSM 106950]|uniref:MBL fold metallo-hydrolase n=1 Tax=Spirosoma sp. TaxID=1899569 RepID=UPI00262BF971|nr:MBL fold metallo-hydrolase [Spirosoma sp.]MBR8837115.1 MBL fold metallo-hydrolase [Stigonema ocellatum SAG 48.90 = DSM 106950]MCX6213868.1 MBL fold metallo-hydrolase [Spirosoma sp.]
MTITKYIHSCLLLEKDGQQLLFDPGKFSFIEGLVSPDEFANVSYIIITHDHPDHLDVPALKQIVSVSQAQVWSTGEVAEKLKPEGIAVNEIREGTFQLGPFALRAISVPHEPILDNKLPMMFAFLIDEYILNTADSLDDKLLTYKGVDLLMLPVTAPFLTELTVARFTERLQPKQILPLHDGYIKPFFVTQRYDNYEPYFAKRGIHFHRLEKPGQGITV